MMRLMRRLTFAALLIAGFASPVMAQGTIPIALQQNVNQNGQPLAGALLYTYVVGTVATVQNTFQDTALTIPNPWPLVADQSGRIPMFYMASGSTHVRLTDSTGLVQFDYPTMLVIGPAGGGGGGGGTVDPTTILSSGDLKVKYGTGPLSGFVRANGLTIGNATSGATERANADTQNLFIFLYGVDPNLVVSGGRTGNALNDYNSNKTITLPDWRGKAITALADMGNSPTSVLTNPNAGCTTTPTTLGAFCGSQSQTLTLAQLPTGITSSVNVTSTQDIIPSNFTSTTAGINPGGGSAYAPYWGAAAGIVIGKITSTGTATSNNTSGAATPTVMPAMLATIYLKL